MARFIELTKIVSDREVSGETAFSDTDEVGENQNTAPVERVPVTTPTGVQVDAIRCYYARKDDRPGTRLTFTDGGGFAVTESYEDVKALITA